MSLPLVKKIFDYVIWVLFFGLLILGTIIYTTNRTYPGDKLYPFKLKFEDFVLTTSKILNKQVDVSIDLVMKRADEVAKILSTGYAEAGLNRLNTQVELTANSITEIRDPVVKKQEAEKYIGTLYEVSNTLSEKQKEFPVIPTPTIVISQTVVQPVKNIPVQPTPTKAPSPSAPTVPEQINQTQQTIQQTIDQMTALTNQSAVAPSPTPTISPTLIPTLTPTSVPTPTTPTEKTKIENTLNNQSDNGNISPSPSPSSPSPSPTQNIQQNNNSGWGEHGPSGNSGSRH